MRSSLDRAEESVTDDGLQEGLNEKALMQHSSTWEWMYGMLLLKAREAAFWER